MGGLRQRLEGRLAALKLRLNLTEQQDQQLHGIIDQKLATAGDITARMIQNQGNPADQKALGALYAEAQTEMQQLLTPEQQTAYQQYTTEERQSNAERMASGELSRLQRDLQLTDEQQDQVFDVLYDQTLQQLQEAEAGGPANGDWAQSFQQRNAARKAALQSVLTPEQMQAYDKMQGARANWMRMFTPGGAGGFPGGSP
jgi:Spy/CpxP family protein refolding chaperone